MDYDEILTGDELHLLLSIRSTNDANEFSRYDYRL